MFGRPTIASRARRDINTTLDEPGRLGASLVHFILLEDRAGRNKLMGIENGDFGGWAGVGLDGL